MLAYNGLTLDRAPDRRPRLDRRPASTPRHPRHRILARQTPARRPATPRTRRGVPRPGRRHPVFATDLPTPTGQPQDLRALVTTLDPATLAYARGILHWQRNQRFCGACGGATDPRDGGHHCQCRDCGTLLFPRIEPAVIVLVAWQQHCLLARHRGARSYATLAGFVEVGENLESAVHREIREEAGVTLTDVHYQASQAWPFPAGLMIGYRAQATGPDITVDHNELDDARWFTTEQVRALRDTEHRTDSIERFLIDTWLAEH